MHIAVVNESTVVTAAQAAAIAKALQAQGKPLAAAWERTRPSIAYKSRTSTLPPDTCVLAVLDDADQADALGYHDVTPTGQPYSKIFAKTILDAGGQVLTTALSVSACASHEMCEMFGDPPASFWSVYDDAGSMIALELCDPVQNDAYVIGGVAVSDFVLPAYFAPLAPAGPRDFMGLLTQSAPALRPGGYAIVAKVSHETQKFAHEIIGDVPAWKASVRGRTTSRLAA